MALKKEAQEFMKELFGGEEAEKDEFEMLLLDHKAIKQITPEDKTFLLEFPELLHISMNACQLTSLENFPKIESLVKLELNDNKFPPEHLAKLAALENLENLKLANSKVATLAQLEPLKGLPLRYLDLSDSPVAAVDGYREKVYAMIPTLEVLDSLDKDGEEAFSDSDLEILDEEDLEEMDEEELKKKIESGELQLIEDDDEDQDEDDEDEEGKDGDKKDKDDELDQAKAPSKKQKTD